MDFGCQSIGVILIGGGGGGGGDVGTTNRDSRVVLSLPAESYIM